MPHETDERLKSLLDTNQLVRERMCLAVLAIDKRFSEVHPRHPRGGPDGGRDIQAKLNGEHLAFGAVGFVNQANDAAKQKRDIAKKFTLDLQAALKAEPKPASFVFFTNIALTMGEKDKLIAQAVRDGVAFCEIFDRERIRIALDSADGLAIRFQCLALPLSEAEQAAFFARWGDDIQSVIATGFQRVESTLQRILFLQETNAVLGGLTVSFELNRTYQAEELGHVRTFCNLHLKEMKLGIQWILFGLADERDRGSDASATAGGQTVGVRRGISGWQWEETRDDKKPGRDLKKTRHDWVSTSTSSRVGLKSTKLLHIKYDHDFSLIRFQPRLLFRDIDEAMFLFSMNASLAEKLKAIHIYANGYKLIEANAAEFSIDRTPFEPDIPVPFTIDELSDQWVRIRPIRSSAFEFSFSDQTPARIFESRQTPNNPVRQAE